MKKLHLFSFAALFAATMGIFFVACQKDEVPTTKANALPSTPLKSVVIENNILKFSSKEDFNDVIKTLQEDKKELENFEKQFDGFVSARQAFDKVDEEALIKSGGSIEPYKHVAAIVTVKGDKHLDPVVDSKYLAILVNNEGLIQIKNTVYKFTRNFVYEFDVDLMPQYENSKNDMDRMQGAKKNPITRSSDVKSERWDLAQCDNYYDSQRRKVSTEIENNSYVLIFEAKARVINRKKGSFGLWYRRYTDGIKLNGSFTVTYVEHPNTTGTVIKPFTDHSSWQAEIHVAVGWGLFGAITNVTGTATGEADPEEPSNQGWLGCTVTK